jgi:protein-S-isoprenylcysteine O-methyltransferase Ste14
MLGLSLVVISMGFLGRSFGIVAANRGLKMGGAYGLVRHPVYAAHVITASGFILVNPHWINVAILAVVLTCQVKRMDAEERLLTETSEYRAYQDKVRYRLVPGVY